MPLRKERRIEACSGLTLINVENSLKLGGCPICRAVRRSEEDLIKNILYEGVNDPQIRKSFRDSLGLCPYHAWLFTEVARRPDVLDGLGSTIIYEDMLSEALDEMNSETLSQGLRHLRECPLCRHAKEVERNLIDDFIECLQEKPQILIAYEESNSILCLRHYFSIYNGITNELVKEEFGKIQVGKINKVLSLMREYIRKADYRVKEAVTSEEALAWVKAVEVLKGYQSSLNMGCSSGSYTLVKKIKRKRI